MSRRHVLRMICLAIACSLVFAGAMPAGAAEPWPGGVAKVAVPTSRVVGQDSYGTAAMAAELAYPGWSGVRDVVVVTGDNAALTDAAVSSSLCWVYDAPLLLASKKSLPGSTRSALAAIVAANPAVTVHVVGSSSAIGAATVAQIQSAIGGANVVEQPWKSATRYSLAANVAERVRIVAAQTGQSVPSVALVANGSNRKRLWDAAAASAISRHTGIPLLLTGAKNVPPSTSQALRAAGSPHVIVVGGSATVTSRAYTKLHGNERWGGTDRYSTAVSVASNAIARGYSSVATFGVAANIPNAVMGAQLVGAKGGVLLVSGRDRLQSNSWSFLAAGAPSLAQAYAFGNGSIAESQLAELRGAAARPAFEDGAPGRYVGKRFRVTGQAGGNTTAITLLVDGQKVATAPVVPWGKFNFTSIAMPASSARVAVVASNPDGDGGAAGRVVKRLKYPSATCIVIDKSDFRLYWVRNNRLVKAYPIAIGRASMETPAPAKWKILAKYRTSPGSVYGPRKMRLFRQRGSHYVFSAYGIHGTNQQWVIGTKASHGCIRMYNRDVLKLFPQVPIGTMVYTRR